MAQKKIYAEQSAEDGFILARCQIGIQPAWRIVGFGQMTGTGAEKNALMPDYHGFLISRNFKWIIFAWSVELFQKQYEID